MDCPSEETIVGFVEGKLDSDGLTRVDAHTRTCVPCQQLITAALKVPASSTSSVGGGVATGRPDLSCRFLVPLLALAEEQIPEGDTAAFFSAWNTNATALRDESGWVSLLFCEELTEWLAARVGIDAIISQTLRESYSPKTMGLLYPFVRAFGSPHAGYARLPSFVRLLNRASHVEVLDMRRNRATIAYRPSSEATRERSPLICQVRRAQIAAGPSIWNLPNAIVEETECQAQGGDRCVYHVAWLEPSRWWRSLFGGVGAAALTWFATGGSWPAVVLALAAGIVAVHLWGARREIKELHALQDQKMSALARVTRLRPPPAPGALAGHADDATMGTSGAQLSATEAAALAQLGVGAPPQPGQWLAGRYRLDRLLGVGGMGIVYSALDQASGQTVALKVLRPELSLDPRWVARMAGEVQMARAIEHPNVCRVMSFGQIEGFCFLTMELATGGSLAGELRAPAREKTWQERAADVSAIVEGLAAVHDAGIVHRDLTPQNILRFVGGRLAIADFGLSVDEPGRTSTLAGTPSYIAPEVLAGGKVNFRSDVWQLGVIMHEVLFSCRPGASGRAPIDAGKQPALDLCMACAHQDPARRPASAGAVTDLLSALSMAPETIV